MAIGKLISGNRGSLFFGNKNTPKISVEQVGKKFRGPFCCSLDADAPLKRKLTEHILKLKQPALAALYKELDKDRFIKIAALNRSLMVSLETDLVSNKDGVKEFLNNLSEEKIVLDELKEEQKLASAIACANADPANTLNTLKCFYLSETDKKTVVLKCVKEAAQEAIGILAKLELSEEILAEAYKAIAEIDGLEILSKFDKLKVKDKKILFEIAEKAVVDILPDEDAGLPHNGGYIAFLLAEKVAPVIENVIDPVKYIDTVSKFDGTFALNLLNRFRTRITDPKRLKDIVEDIIIKYPDTRTKKGISIIVNQVIIKLPNISDRKDIVRTLARNCGGLASEFLLECGIEGIALEETVEILLDAYNNDPIGTIGFVSNYRISDMRGLCVNGDIDPKGENRINPDDMRTLIELFNKAGKHVPHDSVFDQKKK